MRLNTITPHIITMATAVSKGNYSEKKAQDELIAKGWLVEKVKRTRYGRTDFWGCWDLIAINGDKVRFIQVSRKPLYDRGVAYKRKLKAFPCPENCSKEYWYHTDGYFKKKFISDGEERPKGEFFDKIKKNRTNSVPLIKPKEESVTSDAEILEGKDEYEDPTLPF